MAETRTLTGREEIRDWAAARMGFPAIRQPVPSIASDEPVLSFVFDQHSYEDQDQGYDRPQSTGGLEQVEWDEWFDIFEKRGLALVVAEEQDGVRENFYEIVVR
jgi:hypothetical protein